MGHADILKLDFKLKFNFIDAKVTKFAYSIQWIEVLINKYGKKIGNTQLFSVPLTLGKVMHFQERKIFY